ncbi:hypothetical protein TCAL_01725 [Tigriopus californicus]|uniref:Prefoldin subunit 2 n=1 Tax=Tigriopus californicus TaxID=6832 RepID=A0A553PMN1_TIGCA|nr:prefoldin subunit 2-like [Tigriopus californicus]TRY78933.1 hypothetical protein TCAL_01725 [Tigriopus californicus]
MSMASTSAMSKKSQEEIIAQFNKMRNEQRTLASKLSELQMDLNEHKLVLETLDKVSADRRCFRLIGGVLVERNVGQVAPALLNNKDKMSKLVETLEKQLTEKGKSINDYMAQNNIQIRGGGGGGPKKEDPASGDNDENKKSSGVLVEGTGTSAS